MWNCGLNGRNCALIHYVPLLQRAIVLGIPRWTHMLSSAKGAARTKGRPRARWLAAALSEVCNSRWGYFPPPQTSPSNCDCSRCEHRGSVWVGVSKALDRFVASLMVDLFQFNVVWRRKSTDKIQKPLESDLIWSSWHRASGEQRSTREGWVFVCMLSNMFVTHDLFRLGCLCWHVFATLYHNV